MEQSDLSIAIKCECNPCHDWMAFASWYSIKKRLPDSPVFLELRLDKPIFRWANRFGIKILRKTSCTLTIDSSVMAVRDFNGSFEIASSKSDDQSTFVNYRDGCGNFNLSEWINKEQDPFYRALLRFGTYNLTVNEMAILTFWEQCHHVYQSAGVT